MNFEYCYTTQAIGDIEIEDIGNCAIEAFNDLGSNFYMVIKTHIGSTNIFIYGPILPDLNMLPSKVTCNFERIEFDAKKISKKINEFLNNPKFMITQAFEVEADEALDKCRDMVAYMKNYPVL